MLIKNIFKACISLGIGRVVGEVINNNIDTQQMNRITKLAVISGAVVTTAAASDFLCEYADAKIDEIKEKFEACKEDFEDIDIIDGDYKEVKEEENNE